MERKKQIILNDSEFKKIEILYNTKGLGEMDMITRLKEEFPLYWRKGVFLEMLLNKVIKEKSAELLEFIIDIENFSNYKDRGLNLMYNLLKEDWHYSHEEIVHSISDIGNLDSLPVLREAVLIDPSLIDSFAMHNYAIRAIFDIAGKDALPILLGLRKEIDEDASPTLEKIIKRCEALQ